MYPLVAAFVAIWLGLALSAQLSFARLTRLRRWDPFGFIPSWHFFAPNPARFDTVVLVRGLDLPGTDSANSAWSVAAVLYRQEWYYPLFNPVRRIQKAVHDLQNALGNMSEHHVPAAICKSAPAQALFTYVRQQGAECGRSHMPAELQFAIVRVENLRAVPEARVVFVTEPMSIAG